MKIKCLYDLQTPVRPSVVSVSCFLAKITFGSLGAQIIKFTHAQEDDVEDESFTFS